MPLVYGLMLHDSSSTYLCNYFSIGRITYSLCRSRDIGRLNDLFNKIQILKLLKDICHFERKGQIYCK